MHRHHHHHHHIIITIISNDGDHRHDDKGPRDLLHRNAATANQSQICHQSTFLSPKNYHLSKFWQYWYIFCQYWFWYDDRVARRRSVKTSYSVKSYRWCQFLQFSFQHSQTKPLLRGKNKQRLHKIRYFSSFPTSMISQRDRREFGRNIFKTFLGSPTSCGFRSTPRKLVWRLIPKLPRKLGWKPSAGEKSGEKRPFMVSLPPQH